VKIPIYSTTDTRAETDFHIWEWQNNLAMTIYFEYSKYLSVKMRIRHFAGAWQHVKSKKLDHRVKGTL
jgi:hypothetical protein